MLSVRPRELRLIIQHHEAAMMTISCSSFIVYRLSFIPSTCIHLRRPSTLARHQNIANIILKRVRVYLSKCIILEGEKVKTN